MTHEPEINQAIGSVRLEGGDLRDIDIELANRVARGELTSDDAVAIVLAEHAREPAER